VGTDLREFPATLELGLAAMVSAVALGIPLGVFASVGRNCLADHFTRPLVLGGVSMPVFWLALVLQILLYYNPG
jgi:peptide/nickel transport system permease protein